MDCCRLRQILRQHDVCSGSTVFVFLGGFYASNIKCHEVLASNGFEYRRVHHILLHIHDILVPAPEFIREILRRGLCRIRRHNHIGSRSIVIVHCGIDCLASDNELHVVLARVQAILSNIRRRMLADSRNGRIPARKRVDSCNIRTLFRPLHIWNRRCTIGITFGRGVPIVIYKRHAVLALGRIGSSACNHRHFGPGTRVIREIKLVVPVCFSPRKFRGILIANVRPIRKFLGSNLSAIIILERNVVHLKRAVELGHIGYRLSHRTQRFIPSIIFIPGVNVLSIRIPSRSSSRIYWRFAFIHQKFQQHLASIHKGNSVLVSNLIGCSIDDISRHNGFFINFR